MFFRFSGGNRVIDKTYSITVGEKIPEYTLGQNTVINVYHKHKCCENSKNIIGIKEVSGGGPGSGSIRVTKRAEIREAWDKSRDERTRSVKNVTILHSILQ